MTDRAYDFLTAVQLANAVGEFLVGFSDGLPEGGKKGLGKLQGAYKRLPVKERKAYRQRFPHQYDRWVRTSGKPKPPLDAEQPEMFDPGTTQAGYTPTGQYERLGRWEKKQVQTEPER